MASLANRTYRQLIVPRDLLGRVTSAVRLLFLTADPVGVVIAGSLTAASAATPAQCFSARAPSSRFPRRRAGVPGSPRRYRSHDEDSARWIGFPYRDDDIVIGTRSKTGTTWVQMICALLIFQQPRLPAPIAQLSPWLDHLIAPREQVLAQLAAQQHRRFIKTHTPLDGIPLDPRVTYLVTARHPWTWPCRSITTATTSTAPGSGN